MLLSGWSLAGSFRAGRGGGAREERDGRQALPSEEKDEGDFEWNDGMLWNSKSGNGMIRKNEAAVRRREVLKGR